VYRTEKGVGEGEGVSESIPVDCVDASNILFEASTQ